jgi:ribonuclease HI
MKGRKVPDRELWQELAELAATRQVKWTWVQAHTGNPGNERVDRLAHAQAQLAAKGASLDDNASLTAVS